MRGSILRSCIVLLITLGAVWMGYRTYHTLYDVLDFQITLYTYLLSTQEQIDVVKESISSGVSSFFDIFGLSSGGKAEQLLVDTSSVSHRVAIFSSKLKTISGIIGTIIGIFVWKILFDSIFGIKTLIQRLTSFIKEPLHS